MSSDKTTNNIIKAFKYLSTEHLEKVCDKTIYSYNYKHEMIDELESVFNKIRLKGISSLKVKNSKCKFCYPNANAYSFHHPITDEFIVRYVIHQKEKNVFHIGECKNKPIPVREDGMPF